MDMSSEFCGACGAVLLLCAGGATACDVCGSSLPNEEAGGGLKLVTRRRLAPSETLRQLTEAATDVGGAQEAVISETCPQCKNDKMSFHTAQLRSADEGQTIFYTCLKCKYVNTVVGAAHCHGRERQGLVQRLVVGWTACRVGVWLRLVAQLVVSASGIRGICGVHWRMTDGTLVCRVARRAWGAPALALSVPTLRFPNWCVTGTSSPTTHKAAAAALLFYLPQTLCTSLGVKPVPRRALMPPPAALLVPRERYPYDTR